MFEGRARALVDDIFRVLEQGPPEWRALRDLREIPDFEMHKERLIKRLARDLEREYWPPHWSFLQEYEQMFRLQKDQLNRIEHLISESTPGCRFAESRDGGPWFAELISMKPTPDGNSSSGNADAAPEIFVDALKNSIKKTSAIVLVDPYALASKSDCGNATSAIPIIREIVLSAHDLDAVHLHLYCRLDAVDLSEWSRLKESLGNNKLSVYLGDFHDRYILAGQDEAFTASGFTNNWHGKKWWAGSVFGSSINGISKRPTYVLDFKKADIRPIISYIRGVVDVETKWETLKEKRADQ